MPFKLAEISEIRFALKRRACHKNSEIRFALKGRGFSRAVRLADSVSALAAEVHSRHSDYFFCSLFRRAEAGLLSMHILAAAPTTFGFFHGLIMNHEGHEEPQSKCRTIVPS
jgi:hypothetical protein